MKRQNYNLLFAIIPALFFLITFLYKYYAWINYPAGTDPEYNYLFNGIILAHLKFHLNAVGHPGTPVQILIAVIARIIHLFRPGTLWDDVMTNPELYIQAPVYTANTINAIVLLILGIKVYKYSKSAFVAVGMQLTPFAFTMSLEVSCRLMPELIMVSIISAWIIVLVKMLYDDPDYGNFKKYSLIFGILYGFSMATKLTFLSFILIPLIILPDWRHRIQAIVFSALAFCIFAIPVVSNFHKFSSWVTNLFIHKGVYGGGERGLIDLPYFINNIREIFTHTYQLWIPLVILAVIVIIYFRKNSGITQRISVAVILTVMLHFIITAKHYAFYYLLPSLLLMAFTIFLIYFNLRKQLQLLQRRTAQVLFLIPLIVIALFHVYNLSKRGGMLAGLNQRKQMHQEAIKIFKPYLNTEKQKIIVASYYGCSAIEYSLTFGLHESGRYKKELNAEYKKHYPKSILYFPWADTFYDGAYPINPKVILEPDIEYVLFVAEHSAQLMERFIKGMSDATGLSAEYTLLREFRPKAEAAYKLQLKRSD